MTITDYSDNYLMYDNMVIREIASVEEFFSMHEMLPKIFDVEYGFPYSDRHSPENAFSDTDIMVISKLLDRFGDKSFFVFSHNDKHHNDLKALQDKKIINFGIDIHVIHPSKIYVLEMDKTKDPKMYDI